MTRCPYCAEEIQDEAIKCRHCGEFLKKKRKWLNCLLGCLFGSIAFVFLANVSIALIFVLIKTAFFTLFYPLLHNTQGVLAPSIGGPIWNDLMQGLRIFWERATL